MLYLPPILMAHQLSIQILPVILSGLSTSLALQPQPHTEQFHIIRPPGRAHLPLLQHQFLIYPTRTIGLHFHLNHNRSFVLLLQSPRPVLQHQLGVLHIPHIPQIHQLSRPPRRSQGWGRPYLSRHPDSFFILMRKMPSPNQIRAVLWSYLPCIPNAVRNSQSQIRHLLNCPTLDRQAECLIQTHSISLHPSPL